MPVIPESTRTSLAQRLRAHAKASWPQLAQIHVRFRGQFAYVAVELADGEQMPLMRLRTADPPTDGERPSTWRARTATKTRSGSGQHRRNLRSGLRSPRAQCRTLITNRARALQPSTPEGLTARTTKSFGGLCRFMGSTGPLMCHPVSAASSLVVASSVRDRTICRLLHRASAHYSGRTSCRCVAGAARGKGMIMCPMPPHARR
jgi:hypothetical protein